jgi:hypothetical protein
MTPRIVKSKAVPVSGTGKGVGCLSQVKVKCTYKGCDNHFDTEEDMKNHKKHNPDHSYCKKCDVDCDSWEDLTQHKVSVMDEWYHQPKDLRAQYPKHITCEFCGEDFKTGEGRKSHRAREHQADQQLRCPGCQDLFVRASSMIAHLEEGQCEYISAYEFKASILHKTILKEVLGNIEEFNDRMAANTVLSFAGPEPGKITDGTEQLDQEEGGVALLDQEAEEGGDTTPALQPQIDPIDVHSDGVQALKPQTAALETALLTRANVENWPRLASGKASGLPGSMSSMSIQSSTPSRAESIGGSEVASRRSGVKVETAYYTESYPALGSSRSVTSFSDFSDVASDTTGTNRNHKATAWTTGQTSKALFKDAKPVPPPGDWSAHLIRKEEALATNGTNLLYSRFYDPYSEDYTAARFYHTLLEKYCCPFPQCDLNECQYDRPADLAEHMKWAHLQTSFHCTSCLKRFKSAAALVSHMEAIGRCKVKDSDKFSQVNPLLLTSQLSR